MVDGELTGDQLAALRHQLARPSTDPCAVPGLSGPMQQDRCDLAAQLGHELFFDVRLSDATGSDGAVVPGTGKVSCGTCHDPNGYFIDTREPNTVSMGQTKLTGRNTPTVLDVGLKYDEAHGQKVFAWSGLYATPGAVLDLALRKAMSTTHATVAATIKSEGIYVQQYGALFGALGSDAEMYDNAVIAFDAYFRRLAGTSPFDDYTAGSDDAISDAAKRGFGVFVGRGTCIECHSGPAFTDLLLHNTGVPQEPPAAGSDAGRGSGSPDDPNNGKFVTASLRNVLKTAPYMHDGVFGNLGEVIEFYRGGGGPDEYGTKDPRLQPIEISDDDASDLEALLGALTDRQIDPSLRSALCVTRDYVGQLCSGTCADVANDPKNCGTCGHACSGACMAGVCL